MTDPPPRLPGGRVAEKLQRAADELREAGLSFDEAAERIAHLEQLLRLRDERIDKLGISVQAELEQMRERLTKLEGR